MYANILRRLQTYYVCSLVIQSQKMQNDIRLQEQVDPCKVVDSYECSAVHNMRVRAVFQTSEIRHMILKAVKVKYRELPMIR